MARHEIEEKSNVTKKDILAIAKPILFNTNMVRAILDDRKTVTRRKIDIDIINNCDMDVDGTLLHYQNNHGDFIDPVKLCRYQKGDYLYVRETWQKAGLVDGCDRIIESTLKYYYAAGPEIPCFDFWVDTNTGEHKDHMPWHPSIHMPKEAARIFLKVTDVRVERLHTMTLDDFLAEGVVLRPEAFNDPENAYQQARSIFSEIWDSTIPKKDLEKYGWAASPWVWVIQFERVEVQNKSIAV